MKNIPLQGIKEYVAIQIQIIYDVAVTSLGFVRLVLTGKLKNSTRLLCFEISNFRDKQVFLSFTMSFGYNFYPVTVSNKSNYLSCILLNFEKPC